MERSLGFVGGAVDVTERAHAERALREIERRLALVLEGTNDGFRDYDLASGDVQYS